MKNFKFNNGAIEFLRKNKVKLQSLVATILVTSSLVGCGVSEEPNPIENAIVITTTDGEKNIVRKVSKRNCNDYPNENHFHYMDLITGNFYSDSINCISSDYTGWNEYPIYREISNVESITDYLTDEEISKLLKSEFTNEDFANLVIRIKESEIEEVKTK